ncbi:PREDICTED: uncharacterized protein LOC104817835 [Tarenaya hassleriana]|uniref:uncharacterized protein LOC104817835 n=1 Tax=Tarenaya hassleriana TaxID=28532 RepID=UPI00053C4499|nr:PREDICTED: uncharacterized protein LOC104817835 [Tarenaya hassleriana]XP_010545478.1 PREDICTED: uncharacterized protein LOC104817835 [Tarenaya hassleriana]
MESPQSVVSQFNSCSLSNGSEAQTKKPNMSSNSDNFIGALEVLVHQARDIQNICIYHKQDVYAKLCLTSDPSNAVCTKIINGGGRNPVFGDTLELNVKTVDCSLKCEIYMMSRVKNYLEDQLLGFTLVPLSEIILKNGKLEKEFSLSSTDLFHSPAGFVQLSLSYLGDSPEVMPIPAIRDETSKCPEAIAEISNELDKIEFVDPNIDSENNLMVSEYFGIPCTANVESDMSKSMVSSETGNPETCSLQAATIETAPVPTVSTNGVSSPPSSVISGSSGAPNEENPSGADPNPKAGAADSENRPLGKNDEVKQILTVNIEPEQKVVQQEIVDMYMKSMQQFTESLAKMKLPLDIDSPTRSENSTSSSQTPKSAGSRVFYGSRAFF